MRLFIIFLGTVLAKVKVKVKAKENPDLKEIKDKANKIKKEKEAKKTETPKKTKEESKKVETKKPTPKKEPKKESKKKETFFYGSTEETCKNTPVEGFRNALDYFEECSYDLHNLSTACLKAVESQGIYALGFFFFFLKRVYPHVCGLPQVLKNQKKVPVKFTQKGYEEIRDFKHLYNGENEKIVDSWGAIDLKKGCAASCSLTLVLLSLHTYSEDVTQCSSNLLYANQAYSILEKLNKTYGKETLPLSDIRQVSEKVQKTCRMKRMDELTKKFPIYKENIIASKKSQNKKKKKSPKIGLFVAVSPNKKELYKRTLKIWECYCEFRRNKKEQLFLIIDDDVSLIQNNSPNWMRWTLAKKHLKNYDFLVVLDADQFVVPECWQKSFLKTFELKLKEYSITVRDFARPQTLNDGVTVFKNDSYAEVFLDLMNDKLNWQQSFQVFFFFHNFFSQFFFTNFFHNFFTIFFHNFLGRSRSF